MQRIAVGIADDNEIFRRGLIACLANDGDLAIIYDADAPDPAAEVALIVTSGALAQSIQVDVPLIVCTDAPLPDSSRGRNRVLGLLPRAALKPAQLVAAIRAAAIGLQVNLLDTPTCDLSPRHVEVLRLLAEGAATRQISDRLGYSERTIKHDVAEILDELGARSRAEAVAVGIRRGLI